MEGAHCRGVAAPAFAAAFAAAFAVAVCLNIAAVFPVAALPAVFPAPADAIARSMATTLVGVGLEAARGSELAASVFVLAAVLAGLCRRNMRYRYHPPQCGA